MSSGWISFKQQKPPVGEVIQLMFLDNLGLYEGPGEYFLHDDGKLYQIEPPAEILADARHWKLPDEQRNQK